MRKCVEKGAGGFDGVIGKSERSGEDVGGTARYRSKCRGRPGQSVRRLVEGAIATEYDDDIGSVGCRGGSKTRRMAAPGGLGHRDLVVGGEGFGDDHPSPSGDRRGRWIDDEVHLHKDFDRSGAPKVTSQQQIPNKVPV